MPNTGRRRRRMCAPQARLSRRAPCCELLCEGFGGDWGTQCAYTYQSPRIGIDNCLSRVYLPGRSHAQKLIFGRHRLDLDLDHRSTRLPEAWLMWLTTVRRVSSRASRPLQRAKLRPRVYSTTARLCSRAARSRRTEAPAGKCNTQP